MAMSPLPPSGVAAVRSASLTRSCNGRGLRLPSDRLDQLAALRSCHDEQLEMPLNVLALVQNADHVERVRALPDIDHV